MNRRQILQQIAGSSVLLTAGCSSIGENPGPFHFAIVNLRDQHYYVEFAVWDDSDTLLTDGAVDIAPRGDDEYTALDFENVAEVTNGDVITAEVEVAGETFEEAFEVTCNKSDNADNNLFFRIRHPDVSTPTGTGMEFSGSEC
ncbi:hypothetical protein [Natronorubrum daqingense]|uniref:Uncharacterized protein n=1 Tax=Natronorubrum daqingense TaxID=588898 RepID=A0A1N7FGN8_9EURY|nr:hypothetical protein [Natronorubrum daqingense]APX98430.1 hypothetical protein BB347_17135 [Natronorubrum daqingense]SIR99463.1 hypothetical protein SAMN05421809_3210 [Natronorubrum daqingense]